MTLAKGTILGRYEISKLIGAGGMGEVYLANDTELDRTAAIKILPADLALDPQRLQRFVQEAKAASALNHPHILTIYEIGTLGDSRFIATEFIDGQTLRQKMSKGMKLTDILEIGSQIASALAAAHAAGIVHRDIKPENVMVRSDGYVKVLDFGLAKLTEPKDSSPDTEAPTRAMVNTGAGTIMGTANYMSPEQAKGVHVDERTDLWSLGAVIYEMTAGHLPFEGETPTETISLILQKEPPPLTRYSKEVPEELDRIVDKALTKDREERYQIAKDMMIDLKHLKRKIEVDAELDRTVPPELRASVSTHSGYGASTVSGSSHAAPETLAHSGSAAEYIVSGIKQHKKSVAVGVVALIVVAALSFVYFPRRTPALSGKDTVLLTDFANTTGEQVFDGTLKQALAVQLGQSPYLNVYADERVGEALRFMGRSPNERITRDIGKEICVRQGIRAMIAGSIASLGSHYVISLEALNAQEGNTLAREQIEADSKEQVLSALGKASISLREKLGESLASLKKYDAPIEQATTSSLEALKAFSTGNEKRAEGNQNDALAYYKRAVELDPNFALGYARLAVTSNNLFQSEAAMQYASKAYELRDRVSERERYYISEKYTSYVTGDHDEALKILTAWSQSYPADYVPHNNLAVNYGNTGRHEDSLREAKEAVRLNPGSATVADNLVSAYIRLNRLDEAHDTLEQTIGKNPDRFIYRFDSLFLAAVRGDQEAVERELDWMSKQTDSIDAIEVQMGATIMNGQMQRSADLVHRSVELHLKNGEKENAGQVETLNAFHNAVIGRCQDVKAGVSRGLLYSRAKFGLGNAAVALAYCGEAAQAQSIIDELQNRFPRDTGSMSVLRPMAVALINANRGNATQAIDDLQPAMRFEFGSIPGFWLNYFRGEIYLKAKMGTEAAAEFRKILDHRAVESFSALYPLAHIGLARASTLNGDNATARKEYQDFFAAWKDADQDLPILVAARKEYEQIK